LDSEQWEALRDFLLHAGKGTDPGFFAREAARMAYSLEFYLAAPLFYPVGAFFLKAFASERFFSFNMTSEKIGHN